MPTTLFRVIAATLLLPLLAIAAPVPPAVAAPVTQQIVKETATAGTPQVLDGKVSSITRVGDTMVLGGEFTSVREAGSSAILSRTNLVAFNADTGKIDTTFAPVTDGAVSVVIPGPDGTVYVGGAFNNIAGEARRRVAQLRLTDGGVVTGFNAGTVAGGVLDLRLFGNRLFVAGKFTHIAGQAQLGLATLNPTTGKFDPYVRQVFAGTQNGGYTGVLHIDISPQTNRLLAIGNFATVDGSSRRQAVMLDLNGAAAGLSNWQTSFYESTCGSRFESYVRDLDISPDGTFVVISTTGTYGGGPPGSCDTTARFEVDANGTGLKPSWVDYTGGDTTYAVEITDSVVYTGGHARWQNNPSAGDAAGPGAVSRPGIAALDPENGMPLSWNPTRDRGVGVFDFRADEDGLWVASDTERIGPDYAYRPRLALLPVGGRAFDKPVATGLPNDLYSTRSGQGLVRSYSDGSSFGAVSDAPDVSRGALTTPRGAFMLNGDLFTAWSDQSFVRQSFDGTTFGAQTAVDTHNQLVPLQAWMSELAAATSMTYQRGRIYYTLPNDANLYYRYFTPENNVVGGRRNVASASVTGLSFTGVRGMFLAEKSLYTSDASGNLRRTTWADGDGPSGRPVASTTTIVSGPNKDNRSWTGPLFLYQDGQGRPAAGPPEAEFTSSCTSLTCDFDGSASAGDVTSYTWDFGDGQTGDGVKPGHVYAASGNYTVALTVTSSTGATSRVTNVVSVTKVNTAPTASMATSCTELVCSFDGSGSDDSDGTVASYAWDFGDGTTSTPGAVVDHTYASAGTYEAVLTVTDNQGGTDTTTKSVNVDDSRVDFVAATSSNGNRANHSVTVPGSVQAEDLLVLSITLNNSTATLTPPPGWSMERAADQRDTRAIVWTRTATAADAGSTVSVGTSTFGKSDLALVAYRSSTGTARVVSSAISFDTVSTIDHVSPQVGASTDGTWLVTYFSRESSSTAAWQPVRGQTVRTNNLGVGGGNVAATLVDSGGVVAVGEQGGLTGTLSSASSNVVSWSMRVGPN